jgi:hypothetical protein
MNRRNQDLNPWATKPALYGERVILRPYVDADLPALVRLVADDEVQRLTGSVHTSATASAETANTGAALQKWHATRNEQTDRLDLMISETALDHFANVSKSLVCEISQNPSHNPCSGSADDGRECGS